MYPMVLYLPPGKGITSEVALCRLSCRVVAKRVREYVINYLAGGIEDWGLQYFRFTDEAA